MRDLIRNIGPQNPEISMLTGCGGPMFRINALVQAFLGNVLNEKGPERLLLIPPALLCFVVVL
jgi:hypothetical protein